MENETKEMHRALLTRLEQSRRQVEQKKQSLCAEWKGLPEIIEVVQKAEGQRLAVLEMVKQHGREIRRAEAINKADYGDNSAVRNEVARFDGNADMARQIEQGLAWFDNLNEEDFRRAASSGRTKLGVFHYFYAHLQMVLVKGDASGQMQLAYNAAMSRLEELDRTPKRQAAGYEPLPSSAKGPELVVLTNQEHD
jgi:hypothetical protein